MALRSTEKSRISSCTASDEIARAVIRKYTELGKSLTDDAAQLVLAGIVAIHNNSIDVISLAVGNKFSPTGDKQDDSVRDCHAEVLSRRAFKHWLANEYKSVDEGKKSLYFDSKRDTDGILRLVARSDVTWVLYISSAPCGNACIRRWGESPKETFHESLGQFELFDDRPHPPFHPHSQAEGQTAIIFKGQSTIRSCSDKILNWNVLGLQGIAFSGLIKSKIFLDGIVIGRKFVRKHAQRALCCRLSSKRIHKDIKHSLHHPSLMCTAVKLDEGGMNSEVGAIFTERVFWWNKAVPDGEYLDGSLGKRQDGSTSILSHGSMKTLRSYLPKPDPSIISLGLILSKQLEDI